MFSSPKTYCVPESVIDDACILITKRRNVNLTWGWKDPRNTLFLTFWRALIPKSKFVFIYRHPDLVINSLFRRSTDRRLLLNPWSAAQAWLDYNDRILGFYRRYPEQSFLINIDGFVRDHQVASQKLFDFLGLTCMEPFTLVFDPNDLNQSKEIRRNLFERVGVYRKKDILLKKFEQLELSADITQFDK